MSTSQISSLVVQHKRVRSDPSLGVIITQTLLSHGLDTLGHICAKMTLKLASLSSTHSSFFLKKNNILSLVHTGACLHSSVNLFLRLLPNGQSQ